MLGSALRIDLLGTSFSITADEDPVYLESLLTRYRLLIDNTQRTTGMSDPLKIAIITGFLLSDELEKIHIQGAGGKPGGALESRKAEQLLLDVITKIDENFGGSLPE